MEKAVDGVVLLYKEGGMTSQTAVTRVKRLFGVSKAGHTGTLDPMAEGVLPVLIGRAVKASEFLLTAEKHYRAGLLLGQETDTEDTTGTVLRQSDAIPGEEAVRAAAQKMVGEILQVPPMYSAIRVGGKRLMELARAGQTIEREARPVTIYSLSIERVDATHYTLDVHCSKGTYIRTLCADIGRALGCGGCMYALCRMEAGGFPLSRTRKLAEWEALSPEERQAAVIPVSAVFSACPALTLSPFFTHLAQNGQPLSLRKLGLTAACGARYRLYDPEGRFFALAEVVEQGIDGLPALKPIRQF